MTKPTRRKPRRLLTTAEMVYLANKRRRLTANVRNRRLEGRHENDSILPPSAVFA